MPRSRARVAAHAWGALSFAARTEELTSFRKALAEHAEELAELLHEENGKPLLEAYAEVMMALGHVQHATARAEAAMATRTATSGVSSLGFHTTALPAASAYAIDPIGVNSG